MDSILTQVFSEQIASNFTWMIFVFAFLGGVVASVSPCSLGLLPVVVGYVGGTSKDNEQSKPVMQILFFILGLAISLTVVGMICAVTGKALGAFSGPIFSLLMSSLILIFGLHLLEIIEVPMPVIVKEMPKNTTNSVVIGPLLVGAAFAFASAPCATPILAGIMTYASLKANILTGAALLFLFALGQGVILLIAGLFTKVFKKLMKVNAVSGYFVKFSGVILILASLMLYAKTFGLI